MFKHFLYIHDLCIQDSIYAKEVSYIISDFAIVMFKCGLFTKDISAPMGDVFDRCTDIIKHELMQDRGF